MGQDDENVGGPGECPGHDWVPESSESVSGGRGMSITHACRWCGAIRYEPSNYEKFPDTHGLDPRLYPEEVRRLRERRGW